MERGTFSLPDFMPQNPSTFFARDKFRLIVRSVVNDENVFA